MMKPEQLPFTKIPSILPDFPVISIAGAGGKTTLMFSLASILAGPVVTTTTTKVGEKQIKAADQHLTLSSFPPEKPKKIIWVTSSLQPVNNKIIGLDFPEYAQLVDICRSLNWPLIAETDGAAQRHLKAPAAHEPVIPEESNVCFYLVGLDVLNQPMNNIHVHRPEIFSAITELASEKPISADAIAKLIDHPHGGLKNTPANALHIAMLTHADTEERIKAGKAISEKLKHYDYVCIH